VSAERLLKGRKHFSKHYGFLWLFQNSAKLIVFVQPGAKINSSYYCDNVLEQGLLPDVHSLSNDDFLFQQDGEPAHRSRHTVAYLRSNVPEFIEPKTDRQTARI